MKTIPSTDANGCPPPGGVIPSAERDLAKVSREAPARDPSFRQDDTLNSTPYTLNPKHYTLNSKL